MHKRNTLKFYFNVFDLIEDTIRILEDGNCDHIERAPFYHYDKPYVFLRDVDVEPIILESEDVFG